MENKVPLEIKGWGSQRLKQEIASLEEEIQDHKRMLVISTDEGFRQQQRRIIAIRENRLQELRKR